MFQFILWKNHQLKEKILTVNVTSKWVCMATISRKKWLKNSVRKQFLPKVAETLVETCFCQDGLNRFKPRFKPVLAETCQPCSLSKKVLQSVWIWFSDTVCPCNDCAIEILKAVHNNWIQSRIFISTSTQVQFTMNNFTSNVWLSSTNINNGVVRNSYQINALHV